EIGIATGLAWTEVGGEILVTEATLMPGKGHLTLTGKLGDVMQESAQAAMSYVRSKAEEFGIAKDFNKRTDVHVHVPEGAIPKNVLDTLNVYLVQTMDEVLKIALVESMASRLPAAAQPEPVDIVDDTITH